jgi:hypothetical protein
MDDEQLPLSNEILAVMRAAVAHAIASEADFVAPPHLLLALLDDAELGVVLESLLERDKIAGVAKEKKPPRVVEMPEVALPAGEAPPFKRYDTLAFRSTGGVDSRWLDRDAFKVFVEGARRVEDGPYKPKHLALGYVAEALKDGDLLALLGRNAQDVTTAVFGLS